MKLRLHRNSLRFRLSPGDVSTLAAKGEVEESTRLPGGALSFVLRLSNDTPALRAGLEAARITIDIPRAMGTQWAASDTVGLEHRQDLGKGQSLSILIEKDFECLEPGMKTTDEKLYPNPNKTCVRE